MTLQRRSFLFGAVGFSVGAAWVMAADDWTGALSVRQTGPAQPRPMGSMDGLQDWVLTDGDLSALAELDGLPRSEALRIMDNVDIPGAGDYRAESVSSVDACVAACEEDGFCNAFTFARMTHPSAEKRHMCWLKSEPNPERFIDDVHYVSGIRP
jgi:hypothetical protein